MVEMSSPEERYACRVCSYAYDPRNGDPDQGVEVGTPFAEIDEDWVCPWCGAPKDSFVREADWTPESPWFL